MIPIRPMLRPMRVYKIWSLPKDKDEQVRITIAVMEDLARSAMWTEPCQAVARRAIVGTAYGPDKVRVLTDFISRSMRFRFDPKDVEMVRVPWMMADEVLKRGASWGDCDDYAVLLASCIGALGIPTGFVTMATSPHDPTFRHVFNYAWVDNQRVYLDATLPAGYETGNLRTRDWPVGGRYPPSV